jgi:hypothetical protein
MRLGVWISLAALLTTGAGAPPVDAGRGPDRGFPEGFRDGRAFYFTRAVYSDARQWRQGRGSWSVDYPEADIHFVIGLKRLTGVDAYELDHPMRLDDPELRRFPFLYAVEVGAMALSPEEAAGLRGYLLSGGFLMVDDFWGSYEWANFEDQMRRVLPEFAIVELPMDHPVFRTFYTIDEVLQVPNVWQGVQGGPTWERDGYVPHVRGILDGEQRLMVLINWNSDAGDAWEHADNPHYPLHFGNYAYRLGVNATLYGMSR